MVSKKKREYIDILMQQTYDPDARARERAVRLLCPCNIKVNSGPVWHRVMELVCDPDASVRKNAFHVLIDGSPREYRPEIVQALEHLLSDTDGKLKRDVHRVLANYRRTGNLNIDGRIGRLAG